MRDTDNQFTRLTVIMHWAIAIAIIAMLGFGLYLEDMPRSPEKGELMGLHKSVGIIILVLAAVRIYWRFLNKFPRPLSNLPSWQENLAKTTHWLLIILTVLMPLSGILMTLGNGFSLELFGLEIIAGTGEKIDILKNIGHAGHGWGSKLFIFLIALHIVGAIKHQFFDKDGTISRMLGKHVESKR